jgi:mono/diheme cytochrome c family protein
MRVGFGASRSIVTTVLCAGVFGIVPSCAKKSDSAGGASSGSEAALTFQRDGGPDQSFTLSALLRSVTAEEVHVFDPNYARDKRFRALPLLPVLKTMFSAEADLSKREFIFRAKDGYAAYFRGALATEAGAYIAFEDLDVPSWEPVGPARANPGPFYVVWNTPAAQSMESHPRPWQLSRIEMVQFGVAYPHTAPHSLGAALPADAVPMLGYALFREQCFRCHAINREGGRVGPELNVPQNILDYRPEAQVRAYIKNPATFRYGNMPAHPELTERDLDGLVAYLRVMGTRKFDPK